MKKHIVFFFYANKSKSATHWERMKTKPMSDLDFKKLLKREVKKRKSKMACYWVGAIGEYR